jgi:TorA maturation chaperone TorD
LETNSLNESVALGGLMQLLGRLLVEELNPELIDILTQPDVLAVFGQADPDCVAYLSQTWDAAAYEQAAVDYCHLFILPKGVAPMASAWTENAENLSIQIQQSVASLRTSVDLALPEAFGALPEEHAGLLLFIAGRLAFAEDPDIREQAPPFLQATAASWLGKFSDALAGSTTGPFYRSVGILLRQLHAC